MEKKIDSLKDDIRKTVKPSFWDRNKEKIAIGSVVAAGGLIILLGLKKWWIIVIVFNILLIFFSKYTKYGFI